MCKLLAAVCGEESSFRRCYFVGEYLPTDTSLHSRLLEFSAGYLHSHTVRTLNIANSVFFPCGAAAQRWPWPPHSSCFYITHNDVTQSVELLWRVISSSQRPLPDKAQQSQQTYNYALGGIRTHSLSRREAADLRLRPRGH